MHEFDRLIGSWHGEGEDRPANDPERVDPQERHQGDGAWQPREARRGVPRGNQRVGGAAERELDREQDIGAMTAPDGE